MVQSNLEGGSAPYVFFGFVGGVLGVFSAIAFWSEVGQFMADTYRWERTPCTIEGSRVVESGNATAPYAFEVGYTYKRGDLDFGGNDYRLASDESKLYFENRAEADRLALKYPEGASATCWVNPDNPAESTLTRRSPYVALFGLIPVGLVTFGVTGAVLTRRWLRQPDQRKNVVRLVVGFFVVLGVSGAVLLSFRFGIVPLARLYAAQQWQETACVIQSSEIERARETVGGDRWELQYRYEVDGRTYYGTAFTVFDSNELTGLEELVQQYPEGTEAVCYVESDTPDNAILVRDLPMRYLLPTMAYGLGGTIVVGVLGVWLLRRLLEKKRDGSVRPE